MNPSRDPPITAVIPSVFQVMGPLRFGAACLGGSTFLMALVVCKFWDKNRCEVKVIGDISNKNKKYVLNSPESRWDFLGGFCTPAVHLLKQIF